MTPSYPFPSPNPEYIRVEDVICPRHEQMSPRVVFSKEPEIHRALYERAESDGARLSRLQYLVIEEELEQAFRYVNPAAENAGCFSLKFAEIIRAAANAYEIQCKALYARFYNGHDRINIYNYLALDRFLKLADRRVNHVAALGSFAALKEVAQPFANSASWDQMSPVTQAHVPGWWTAYNKVKHTNQGLERYATLANATAAVAAMFLLIEAVFGFGILRGGLWDLPYGAPHRGDITIKTRWTRLFA
jgi:hypothetical protein